MVALDFGRPWRLRHSGYPERALVHQGPRRTTHLVGTITLLSPGACAVQPAESPNERYKERFTSINGIFVRLYHSHCNARRLHTVNVDAAQPLQNTFRREAA